MGRADGPQWTPEDVDLALEWQAEQAMLHRCGFPIDETSDPDNEQAFGAKSVYCDACHAIGKAIEAFKGDRHGHTWVAYRKPETDEVDAVDLDDAEVDGQ